MAMGPPAEGAPSAEAIWEGWRTGLEENAERMALPAAMGRGTLLDGLMLIQAGRVGPLGNKLSISRLIQRALEADVGDDLPAVVHGLGEVPFRPELARRLLAMGILDTPSESVIDPFCRHAGLSLARAIVAVELVQSAQLADVVGLRLRSILSNDGDSREWLAPILADELAHGLLVVAIANGGMAREGLIRDLVTVFESDHLEQGMAPRSPWDVGPLGVVCALGAACSAPDESEWLVRLTAFTRKSVHWNDDTRWPIRVGGGIERLREVVTETVARAFGVAERLLWRGGSEVDQASSLWPPLGSFVWSAAARTTGQEATR